MSSLRKLLEQCVQCTRTFSPVKVSLENHIEDFIKDRNISDEATQVFIQEVVESHHKYNSILRQLVESFLDSSRVGVSRSDRTLFELLLSIFLWKLRDLGYDQFEEILLAFPSAKILPFLAYFNDEGVQRGVFRDICGKFLDLTYVDEEIIKSLREYAPQLSSLQDRLVSANTYVTDQEKHAQAKKKPTAPEPFNLSHAPPSSRKQAPEPEPSSPFRARPVPASVLAGSLGDVTQERAARLQETRARTFEQYATDRSFRFESEETVQRVEAARKARDAEAQARALAEARAREAEETQLRERLMARAREAPEAIRLTSAAVLRENALYKKLERDKADAMLRYVSDLMDAHEFEVWQREMLAMDEADRRRCIEERKEALMASQQAMAARARDKVETLQARARDQRAELLAAEEAREREREAERERNRERKVAVEAEKAQVAVAVGSMREDKAAQASELRRERESALEAIAREKELELDLRRELIAEIQAMTRLSAANARLPKVIDPTARSGIGSLVEMSLAELRERLAEVRLEAEEEEKSRRAQFTQVRAEKEDALEAMMRANDRARGQREAFGGYVRGVRAGWAQEARDKANAAEKSRLEAVRAHNDRKESETRLRALEIARGRRRELEEAAVRERTDRETAERRNKDLSIAAERREMRRVDAEEQEGLQKQALRDKYRRNRLQLLKEDQARRDAGVRALLENTRTGLISSEQRESLERAARLELVQAVKGSRGNKGPLEPMTLSRGLRTVSALPNAVEDQPTTPTYSTIAHDDLTPRAVATAGRTIVGRARESESDLVASLAN